MTDSLRRSSRINGTPENDTVAARAAAAGLSGENAALAAFLMGEFNSKFDSIDKRIEGLENASKQATTEAGQALSVATGVKQNFAELHGDVEQLKQQLAEVLDAKRNNTGPQQQQTAAAAASSATRLSYADTAKLTRQLREQEDVDRTVIISCMPKEDTTLAEQQEAIEMTLSNSGEVSIVKVAPSTKRSSSSSNGSTTSNSDNNSRRAPQPRMMYRIKFSSAEARRDYYRHHTWEALQRSGVRVRLPLTRLEQQHEWSVARPIAELIRTSKLGLSAHYTGTRIRVWCRDEYSAVKQTMDTSGFTAASMPQSLEDPWLQQWINSSFGTSNSSSPSTPKARSQPDTAEPMDQSPRGSRKQAAAGTPDTTSKPLAKAARRSEGPSSGNERSRSINRFAALAGGSA
jgi:hypothetical protein